jgi:hypothetical protein
LLVKIWIIPADYNVKMNKKKVIYFERVSPQKINFKSLKPKHLVGKVKFVQVNIKDEDYFFVGRPVHSDILEFALDIYGIEYYTKEYKGIQIPVEKGDEYKLLGAGRVMSIENKLQVYWRSVRYLNSPTHKGNLENVFGKKNVVEYVSPLWPFFLVDWKNNT